MYQTLVECDTLGAHLGRADWAVVDCRFDLADPERGRTQYLAGHVPGARYAHLERDLSAAPRPGGGRHPLPEPQVLAATLGRLGAAPGIQVVAYDDAGGAFAARLWWLLRYMGHDAVAVLDGGWQAWLAAGGPVETGEVSAAAATFTGAPRGECVVDAADVASAPLLVDARDARRYRGEYEPIDPVAGHIPGARNRPYTDNLAADGRFKPVPDLRAEFAAVLGGTPAAAAVFYCGSGVTACHDLLALAHAGLGTARLYPGSWSEWCSDPRRPVATGEARGRPTG